MASEANLSRLSRKSPVWGRLAAYLQKRDFLLYRNTGAKYFADGGAFFDDLIGHLRQAEIYIFSGILYFGRGPALGSHLRSAEGTGGRRGGGLHHFLMISAI